MFFICKSMFLTSMVWPCTADKPMIKAAYDKSSSTAINIKKLADIQKLRAVHTIQIHV